VFRRQIRMSVIAETSRTHPAVPVGAGRLEQRANVPHCTQTGTEPPTGQAAVRTCRQGEHLFVFKPRQTSGSGVIMVYLHSEFSRVFTTIRQVRLGCYRLFVGRLPLLGVAV
jgi:hypothetical protein